MPGKFLSTAAKLYEKLSCRSTALGAWLWRSLKVIGTATSVFDGPLCYFLLVICGKNVSVMHHFQDMTTITVYMSACDLEKFFIFNKAVEITGHVCSPIQV